MFYEKGIKGFISRSRNKRAFTFIEVVLVTVILLVLAATAVPNFTNTFRHYQLQNISKNMAHLMRYAQSRAITRNVYLKMIINEQDRTYQLLEGGPANGEAANAVYERLKSRFGRKFRVPEEINVEATKHEVVFYPDGEIDKVRLGLCQEQMCKWLSTQEQRGHVWIFDYTKE